MSSSELALIEMRFLTLRQPGSAFSYECVAVDNAMRVACVRGECKVLACGEGFDLDKAGTACREARPAALTVRKSR